METRIAAVADPLLRTRLAGSLQRVVATWGSTPVEMGAWHGDWGHWNMAVNEGSLALWDWERFGQPVPIGFDGLHFLAQAVRPHAADRDRQERDFLAAVPEELDRFGVPASSHEVSLLLYLVEVGVRYATDLNHPSGEHVRRRLEWALQLLERRSDHVRSPLRAEGA
jgi:hypothetical protein